MIIHQRLWNFHNIPVFLNSKKKVIGLTVHKFKEHQIINFINNNFGHTIPLACLEKEKYIMIINDNLHEIKVTNISYSLIDNNQCFETLVSYFKNKILSVLFQFHIEYKEGNEYKKLTCNHNDVIFTRCNINFEHSEIKLFNYLNILYPKEMHNYNTQKQIDKILNSLYFTRKQINRQNDIIEKLWMISQNKRYINMHVDEMSSNDLEILMQERCIYTKKDLEKYKFI